VLGRPPTDAELDAVMGLAPRLASWPRRARTYLDNHGKMTGDVGDDPEALAEHADPRPGGREIAEPRDEERYAAELLRALDDREPAIIAARLGLGEDATARTLEEVGRGLGNSRERVRQIEARALIKLRVAAGVRYG